MDDLKETIYKLEEKLQKPDVRKSIKVLDDFISEDLIEFGSSGQKEVLSGEMRMVNGRCYSIKALLSKII